MSGLTPYGQPARAHRASQPSALERAQAGLWALAAGKPTEARTILEQLAQEGPAEAAWLVGLALACRDLDDPDSAMAWVDKALAIQPDHVRGALLKAELLARAGRSQEAASFYLSALRYAGDPTAAPPEIRLELERAKSYCDSLAKNVEARIRAKLRAGTGGARFDESVDLLLGKRQLYLSQPKFYFYPGLAHRAFFDNAEFSFVPALEAATAGIRAELEGLLRGANVFEPYVRTSPNRPNNSQAGMAGNPAWGAYYLWKDGQPVKEHLARCPRTAEAIAQLPLCEIPGRSPSVLFSRLL
ncbi:MAG: tetratricopeptide repeat protein, partial [Betaproteobacteria bacterium]|nr:tetratricopeptide repeat protein [Betaproteobacteria bacterium]